MSKCRGHVSVVVEYDVLKDREFSLEHGRLYPSMSAIIDIQSAQFAIGIGWEDAKILGRRFGGSVDRHLSADLQRRIQAAIEIAAKQHVAWLTKELAVQRFDERFGHIEKSQIGDDPPDNPAERIDLVDRITVRPWNDKDDFPVTERGTAELGCCSRCGCSYDDCVQFGCL